MPQCLPFPIRSTIAMFLTSQTAIKPMYNIVAGTQPSCSWNPHSVAHQRRIETTNHMRSNFSFRPENWFGTHMDIKAVSSLHRLASVAVFRSAVPQVLVVVCHGVRASGAGSLVSLLCLCTFPSCHLRTLTPKQPVSEAVAPRYAWETGTTAQSPFQCSDVLSPSRMSSANNVSA